MQLMNSRSKERKKGEFDLYQKPLILEDNISKVNKKNETYEVPKFTQQLIEEAEKVNLNRKDNLEKKEPLNKNKKNNIKNFSVNEKKDLEKEKRIIAEVHSLMKSKVRKSTIKIILDQQKEIKLLNENVSNLRKNDFKNLKINKKLKQEIENFLNNEKLLKFKFEEFQKKIADFQEKEIELLNNNKNLEKDITELKDNVANIKIINNNLNKNNQNMMKQIDNFIINEKFDRLIKVLKIIFIY